MTPLIHASKAGHEGTMRVLLQAGAAVEAFDIGGRTPLMHASSSGQVGAQLVLLEAGAMVDSRNNNGGTALMHASVYGQTAAMRVLLQAGAVVDATDNGKETALMHACACEHEGAVRKLLKVGAVVDRGTEQEWTALMFASKIGHEGIVRVLLYAKAMVDVIDIKGGTALLVAIRFGKLDVARILLKAGAELPPQVNPYDRNAVEMQQRLALLWDERRVQAAEEARARTEAAEAAAAEALLAAEAAAEAAADALLAEEEADKSSAELRQARAKRKKQRQKTKRAETAPGPTQVEDAPTPFGADPPRQCSDSQVSSSSAPRAGVEEEPQAATEEDAERGEGGASAGAGRRASQASDGAGERGQAEEEEPVAAAAAPLDPPPVVSVSAEEVIRALEVAGSNGEVGEGGFGKVFAAELPSLVARWGRVAVKCASGPQAADILHEVATLRLCSHRNVLPLLGYCDDARAPCMVTPLMRGGSLDDRLLLAGGALERLRRLRFEGDACLDWQRRFSALCDAARGLAHLHGERILHRDVKTANILLEGALRPLPMAHGPPLLVHHAVLSDVGLAEVRDPTLDGATHATTRNLAFSIGFVDQALVNSSQHSERTDAFGIGICILMSLVSEPAFGLMKDHEEDVCEAFEDGTGSLFGTAHAAAGWPSDATRALEAMVNGLSMVRNRKRQPLAEALAQMEALLGAAGGEGAMAQPTPVVVGAAPAVSRPLVSPRGESMPPMREDERPLPGARAVLSAQPEVWSGGELTRMVRQLEVGDADASLARKRERVTKAYDSMMVRLERVYADQGHAPLPADEQELRKIDLLAPRHLGRLNGLAHTMRKWWNAAKHQRDQWVHPPSDKEVQRLVREVIKELDGLGW